MTTTIQRETLVNRPEAARILGVRVQTLAVWACRRTGPAFLRIGRSVRYRVTDLENYVQAGRVTTRDQE